MGLIMPSYLKRLGQQKINSYYAAPTEKTEIIAAIPFTPNPGSQTQVWELTQDCKKFPFFAIWYYAGIGTGKSTLGAAFCARRSEQDPTGNGLICANTYPQLANSTIPALIKYCRLHNIELGVRPDKNLIGEIEDKILAVKIAKHHQKCYLGGVHHFVLSAENFTGTTENAREGGRGLEVNWIWFDEGAYADESAFNTLTGRVGRGEGKSKGLIFMTSSINKNNPYNYAYDLFIDEDREEAAKKQFLGIQGTTYENPHLPDDYIERLKATYTPELFGLEVESRFITVATDRIAYYFSQEKHVISPEIGKYNPSLPLHISFDFNNSPACAAAAQLHEDEESEELIIIKEWYLVDGDGTYNLSKTVVDWVKELLSNHREEWRVFRNKDRKVVRSRSHTIFIYGDASGNQKTANSLKSNWQIVFEAFKDENIRTVSRVGTHNPNLVDSFNQINNILFHQKVFVNRQCKELIKDLEVCKKDKSGAVDKTDKKRSHLFDIFRYLLWDIFPVFRANREEKNGTCG